jgi:hypothetical protein
MARKVPRSDLFELIKNFSLGKAIDIGPRAALSTV